MNTAHIIDDTLDVLFEGLSILGMHMSRKLEIFI